MNFLGYRDYFSLSPIPSYLLSAWYSGWFLGGLLNLMHCLISDWKGAVRKMSEQGIDALACGQTVDCDSLYKENCSFLSGSLEFSKTQIFLSIRGSLGFHLHFPTIQRFVGRTELNFFLGVLMVSVIECRESCSPQQCLQRMDSQPELGQACRTATVTVRAHRSEGRQCACLGHSSDVSKII